MKTLFVSSTYPDMAGEREVLHRQVLPRLKETARHIGQDVELCDPRWGKPGCARDSEQGCRRLLSVCLDEIDGCDGYMIVLVGQRYGWIPSADLVRQVVAERENFDLEDMEQSVTALEIAYGVFDRKDAPRKTLFYFREIDGDGAMPAHCRPESALHAKRLLELKERIEQEAGDRVRTYHVRWDEKKGAFTGLEDFAQMVEEDVRQLLQLQGEQAAQTPEQRDLRCQWEMAHQRVREFSCGNELVSRCMRTADALRAPLVLRGAAGSGKSTLMGKLAQEFERRGDMVLPIFCGKTDLCRTEGDILRYMCRFVRQTMGEPPAAESSDPERRGAENCRQLLAELLERYAQNGEENLVFLLDDTDRLLRENTTTESFLPDTLPERVKIIVTRADTAGLPAGAERIDIAPLSGTEIMEMARGIFRAMKHEPDMSVLSALAEKPGAKNPLYLSLLIRRLALMERDDFRRSVQPAQQVSMIASAPEGIAAMAMDILGAVTQLLGDAMAVQAGAFLAVSCYGLRESDLEGIFTRIRLPWDALSFARFRKYMGRLLYRRGDGRYDYRHQALRSALLECLKERKVLHRTITRHLLSLPAGDPIRMGETVWHTLRAEEYGSFVQYIESLDEDAADLTDAARDTALMLAEAGDGWLLEILEKGMDYGCGQRFLAFLGEPLALSLGSEEEELRLHRDILLAAVRLAERRAETLGTEESRKTAIDCRNRAGRACYRLNDETSLAMVTEMQEKQLSVAEALLARENTPAGRRKLMSAYAEVAGFYEKQGGEAHRRKALSLHEKRLLQWRLLARQEQDSQSAALLAEEYEKYAAMYTELGAPEDMEKAESLRKKALEIRVELAENATEPKIQRAAMMKVVSAVMGITGTDGGRAKALEVLERMREKHQEICAGEDDSEESAELAVICFSLGETYALRQEREDLLKALEVYQQSFLLRRELSKQYATAESRMELALCYERMGGVYGLLGGAENLHRALELLNRGLTLRRKLHAKLDTAESALALAVSLHQMGKLCAAFGGERNLRQAKDILESALPLHRRADEEMPTAGVRPEQRELTLTMAEVKAELAELEAQRAREDEERRLAQIRLEEEELAREAEENAQAEDEDTDGKDA